MNALVVVKVQMHKSSDGAVILITRMIALSKFSSLILDDCMAPGRSFENKNER